MPASGGITESDVTLGGRGQRPPSSASNVRANAQARELAGRSGTEIRYHAVIYDVVGRGGGPRSRACCAPRRASACWATPRSSRVFSVGRVGKVAGCRVTDGLVRRGAKVRLLRDDVVIHDGALKTLRRFKDDVREVKEGYECGMSFENYSDVREGDVVEFYEIEEVARTLEA